MTETKPKRKKKKYPYTRELVRIALDQDMTQTDIAQLCRVQQSKVSAWSRGETKAFEHEIAELKKRFGHRLNRTTSRVYLVTKEGEPPAWREKLERARSLLEVQERLEEIDKQLRRLAGASSRRNRVISVEEAEVEVPESEENLQEVEALKKERVGLGAEQEALGAAKQELQAFILPGDSHHFSLEALLRLAQADYEVESQKEQVTQVEGPIVLRYTFVKPELLPHGRNKEVGRLPVARWLIHRQPDGAFVLVAQERRTLKGTQRWRWWVALRNASGGRSRHDNSAHEFSKWTHEAYVESADDAARWISRIHGPMDATALLSHCDSYFREVSTLHGPHDEAALPFLLKKMLIEQGGEVPGVERIVAEA